MQGLASYAVVLVFLLLVLYFLPLVSALRHLSVILWSLSDALEAFQRKYNEVRGDGKRYVHGLTLSSKPLIDSKVSPSLAYSMCEDELERARRRAMIAYET